MRILHILDHSIPLHSGYAFRTLAILREQRKLGWETFHITGPKQKGCATEEEQVDGWHFFRTSTSTRFLRYLRGFGEIQLMGEFARRLEQVAKRIKPDVLHAHSPVLNALPALRVGRRLHIPVVYEVRAFWEDAAADHGVARAWGLRYRLTRAIETYALKRVDAVTTICEGLRSEMISRGIPQQKMTIIPNAVDIEQFTLSGNPDTQLRRTLGLEDCVVLGFIGSFYVYEGLMLLLEAFPTMLKQIPKLRLLLVGGGPQEQVLKQRTSERGMSEVVIFAGRVPNSEVARYYDLIDLLVYPRLSTRLTNLVTPLKPLEAMAQGRLVLASDVGGHRELIRDWETGVLFKANDVDDLSDKVLTLLATPSAGDKLKTNARRYVELERNWTRSVANYQNAYAASANVRLLYAS